MIGTAVNQTNPHKILNLNKIKVQNIMLKIFISKICKYKRGPKYENINIFFPFAKTFEMLRHAEPDFLKRNLVLIELLKKGPMKWKMACVSLGVLFCVTFVHKKVIVAYFLY